MRDAQGSSGLGNVYERQYMYILESSRARDSRALDSLPIRSIECALCAHSAFRIYGSLHSPLCDGMRVLLAFRVRGECQQE